MATSRKEINQFTNTKTSLPSVGDYIPVDEFVSPGVYITKKMQLDAKTAELFGANGDGITDDTTALQNAINAKVLVTLRDGKTYKITSTLVVDNSAFDARGLVCIGRATIDGSSLPSGSPMIYVKNGSGYIARETITGITFSGSGAQNGVKFSGPCGWRVQLCIFRSVAVGIDLSNNELSGTFTEDIVGVDCRFESTCKTALRYTRGIGDESFHGSGLVRAWIDKPDGYPAIQINDGCLPYNAPMDFICFAGNAETIIQTVGASNARAINFHGNIRTEGEVPVIADGDRDVFLIGGVTGLGYAVYGRLKLATDVRITGPSASNISVLARELPQYVSKVATSGNDVVIATQGWEFSIIVSGSGFNLVFDSAIVQNAVGSQRYLRVPNVYVTTGYPFSVLNLRVVGNDAVVTMPADGQINIYRRPCQSATYTQYTG